MSRSIRSFVEATIRLNSPNGGGNICRMEIATAINNPTGCKPGGRSTPELGVPVLEFHAIVEGTGTAGLVDLLRIKLGFPKEVFECAVRPVIAGYAEVVQMLPATDSDLHARPGGLFVCGLELGCRALDYRRGQILPRGAAPEVIGAHAHRWSYAVFVAALLNSVGTNVPEISQAHPVRMFERVVPPHIREWLEKDPALMRELLAFLSGEESTRAGAISELVRRAAGESASPDVLPTVHADRTMPSAAGIDTGQITRPASVVEAVGPNTESEYLDDVEDVPAGSIKRSRALDSGSTQASDTAGRFMSWLRQGLADGTLRANQAGAFVHFVPEGMLLVSPRIFREFARHFAGDGKSNDAAGEPDIGKPIQRQLLRAGWHLRADKGVNILTYQVMRGNRAAARLSGIVICEPGRFIDAVLPVNPLLLRSHEKREGASPHDLST